MTAVRLGRTAAEVAGYIAAARAFEAAWMREYRRDPLSPALITIVELADTRTESIVQDAIARHVRVRIPCRVARPRARIHHRQRCGVRIAGRQATTGDPDDQYPRQVWPTKGGAS
jgi:hypothetical protein